jgi:hypothetical protein
MEVCVYNCRDLLDKAQAEHTFESGARQHGGGGFGGGGMGGGGGGGFFQVATNPPTTEPGPAKPENAQNNKSKPTKRTPTEMLIEVLTTSTAGPWEAADGDGGTITAFDGLLVVRNNQKAQHDVQMVLDMLRAADKLHMHTRSAPKANDNSPDWRRDPQPSREENVPTPQPRYESETDASYDTVAPADANKEPVVDDK